MFKFALATSLIALASAPLLAQDQDAYSTKDARNLTASGTRNPGSSVSVIAAPNLLVWSSTLGRSLSMAMRYPQQFSNEQLAEGWARVSFKCSESGTPVAMTLMQSSGNLRIDRAALAAVRRIKTLHPLPAGVTHGQRYVAELIFAGSPESNRSLIKQLRLQSAMKVNHGSGKEIVLAASANRVPG